MRYLVVHKLDDGIAHLQNVRIVDADNAVDACFRAKELEHTTSNNFQAWRIDQLPNEWGYYQ